MHFVLSHVSVLPHDPVILQPFSLVVLGIITTFANEK